MSGQVRCPIDRDLVRKGYRTRRELNLSPAQAMFMVFGQRVRLGGLPFRPSTFPALEDYRVVRLR